METTQQLRPPPPKPIRVGIIGLSVKPSAWATLAHLPRLAKSPNYQIVALCNSTLASTHAAIEAHNLPSTTRAYDTYEGLASDPDIDLYVVSTRADTHFDVALPALKKGVGSVFIEWPLAASYAEAIKMLDLAHTNNVQTIIGLQGRASPSILKIKQLVDSGRLGDIHSVNYQGFINVWQNNAASRRYHHFIDRKAGGNLLTIYGGHVLDSIFFCIGEPVTGSESILSGNLRREMSVQEDDGKIGEEIFEKDTPDQMVMIARLQRKPVEPLFSFHLRAGARFVGGPGSVWRIYGTRAELVVEFTSAGPQIGKATRLVLSDFEKGEVSDLTSEVDEGGEEWTQLPSQGQNIGRLYEAFAEGREYADWDTAVRRHELIEKFFENME